MIRPVLFLESLTLLMGLAACPVVARAEEPVIGRRPLREWMEELRSPDDDARLRASMMIEMLGARAKAAVPALVQALGDPLPTVRRSALHTLRQIGPDADSAVPSILPLLNDPVPQTRQLAASVLCSIGPAAKPAIPQLVEMLNDKNDRTTAMWALQGIGEPAIPSFIKLLDSNDDDLCLRAASSLRHLGAKAKQAVPRLVAILNDKQRSTAVRSMVVNALGCMIPERNDTIPHVIGALEDADEQVSSTAAYVLRRVDDEKVVVPVLMQALKDKRGQVRWAAADSLGSLGPKAKAAVQPLCKLLEAEQPGMRNIAARALMGIGPEAKEAVPSLIKALQDEDHMVRFYCVKALGEMNKDAEAAVPALLRALDDKVVGLRDEAARVLKLIDPDAAKKAGID